MGREAVTCNHTQGLAAGGGCFGNKIKGCKHQASQSPVSSQAELQHQSRTFTLTAEAGQPEQAQKTFWHGCSLGAQQFHQVPGRSAEWKTRKLHLCFLGQLCQFGVSSSLGFTSLLLQKWWSKFPRRSAPPRLRPSESLLRTFLARRARPWSGYRSTGLSFRRCPARNFPGPRAYL